MLDLRIAKNHARMAVRSKILPRAMDSDDCFQEAVLYMLENPEKDSTYVNHVLPFHLRDLASGLWVGPPEWKKSEMRKAGVQCDYGEYSLEDIVTDGNGWEDFFDCHVGQTAGSTSPEPSRERANDCLQELNAQLENCDDAGISWAKSRNKYHVEVRVCKRQQFIGQFLTIEESRGAKRKFLESFAEYVRAAMSDGPDWLIP